MIRKQSPCPGVLFIAEHTKLLVQAPFLLLGPDAPVRPVLFRHGGFDEVFTGDVICFC
jgi:hypothetical protein